MHSRFQRALHDAEVDDHPQVGVVLAVEDQGLQGGVRAALRGGDAAHDVLQHRLDVDALLGGNFRRIQGGQTDDVLNLVLHTLRVGGGQVNFVQHGTDL